MPNYDVAAFCGKMGANHDCAWNQYSDRLWASKLWPVMIPSVRIECVGVNLSHDYRLLAECLNSRIDYSLSAPGGRGSMLAPSYPAPVLARPTIPPMPNYDVAAICAGPGYDSCAHEQYIERGFAAAVWGFATPKVRGQCLELGTRHDYKVLDACVRLDGNAQSAAVDDTWGHQEAAKRTASSTADFPGFDIGKICGDLDGCWNAQTSFERWSMAMWEVSTPAVRAECVAVNTTHNYGLMAMCLEAHENDRNFQSR